MIQIGLDDRFLNTHSPGYTPHRARTAGEDRLKQASPPAAQVGRRARQNSRNGFKVGHLAPRPRRPAVVVAVVHARRSSERGREVVWGR